MHRNKPSAFARFKARWEGRRDGSRSIPSNDEERVQPQSLLGLGDDAEERLQAVAEAWEQLDVTAQGEIAELEVRLIAAERGVVSAEAALNAQAGAEPTHPLPEQRAFEPGSDYIKDFAAEVPEPSITASMLRLPRPLYFLLMLLLAAFEFPLNMFAFRLFGEAEFFTWIIAAGLSLVLVVCAHLLGIFLAVPEDSRVRRRSRWILILVGTTLILSIAMVRRDFVESSFGSEDLSPLLSMFTFMLMNIAMYAAATFLSYVAHNPHRAVEAANERRQAEIRRLQQEARLREEARREREFARLKNLREQEIERREAPERRLRQAREYRDEIERALRSARARRDENLQRHACWAEGVASAYKRLMRDYCAANVRAREGHICPPVLAMLPSIAMPDIFVKQSVIDVHVPSDGNGAVRSLRSGQ